MLIYFTSRVISSTAAFLYPGYASYKTLSQRPASEEDLERWLMYWSVLGCIVGVEYVAEWLVSWLPLYYPMKTIFLLYLCLPQTRGSSYLYTKYLQPFFHAHETDIDAALVSMKTRVYAFVQEKIRLLWDQVAASLGQSSTSASATPPTGQPGAAPPTMRDPMSGPAQLLGGLWRSYGPTIIASGAALLRQTAPAAAGGAAPSYFDARSTGATAQPPPAPSRMESTQSVIERRRQLEAELAALEAHTPSTTSTPSDSPMQTMPTQQGSSSFSPSSRTDSDADLRSRGGQFEEVEVPSDVEGYDVRPGGSSPRGKESEQGHAYDGKGQAGRTSWFGWGGAAGATQAGSPGKGTYERVKDE
ncbi:hypothetical protein BD410DRAFT_713386 [Rickenella mellea]|uniref:Protein YOP1 n=1 Tax=Rickenella mellea TaxID=50990 RepID=A0A4Y7QKF1_9AGAM|nr:hypothetical protein BD410DRAFT_713386 [Rickenella mellea]